MKNISEKAKKPNHPCFNCPDRCGGCALTCDRWKKYEEKRSEYYAAQKKAHDLSELDSDIWNRRVMRVFRRSRNKKGK